MNDGLFITIEGIDGSGKSFASKCIEEEIDSCLVTREPSDLWTGEIVRDAISSGDSTPMTDFHLFMADRSNHIEKVIEPALDDGEIVISDRFTDSTRAYQYISLQDELGPTTGNYIETVVKQFDIEPDLTLYMNISIDTALERCGGDNRFEKREYLEEVKERYDTLRMKYSKRFYTIDAEASKEEVKEQVITAIEYHINRKRNNPSGKNRYSY